MRNLLASALLLGLATARAEPPSMEMSPLVFLPPAVGFGVSGDGVSIIASAPIYLQLGKILMQDGPSVMRAYQLGLEPSVRLRPLREESQWRVDWQPTVALGARRRWGGTPLRWAVGLWTRAELLKLGFSLEPEAVLFFGDCCNPGSVELSARVELAIGSIGGTVRIGFSYW